ncbi:MAG: DUF58 domain-containing protein [Myxococcota bacterium]|nr:DUF58 domain-containing protein [Myxococcota bacterium]
MESNERTTDLLDPELITLLERLSVAERELVQDRSGHAGPPAADSLGVDFYEYASYQPGIDVRHVDWAVYGRTGSLRVRSYESHQEQPICVLLDLSASMGLGAAEGPTKFALAHRLAAAIAYVGLVTYHPVRLIGFAKERLEVLPHRLGREAVHEMLRFLGRFQPAGETSLATGIAAGLEDVSRKGGRIFVLSDFLDPAGLVEAFGLLGTTRRRVDLVAIVAPGEEELPTGASLGEDPETGQAVPLQVTPELAADYAGRVRGQRQELARRAHEIRAHLATFPCTAELPDVVTELLG